MNDKSKKNTTEINYIVNQKLAETFLQKLNKCDTVQTVEPIIYQKDTLAFLFNMKSEKGWYLISGDKRSNPILSLAETGNINLKNSAPGALIWLNDAIGMVQDIRKANPANTISENYKLWTNLENYITYIEKIKDSIAYQKPPDCDEPDQIIDVIYEYTINESIDPLIQTKWGQGEPWNQTVPAIAYNSVERCPTGCVAVAGAQMLYYHHYKSNKPAVAYETGICNGYSASANNKSYNFSFSNATNSAWQFMKTHKGVGDWDTLGAKLVSNLMGYVGMKVNMNYLLDGSGANTDDLQTVYSEVGLQSNYDDYDAAIVKANLANNQPVNIRAYGYRQGVYFMGAVIYYDYSEGHSWIIDGFRNRVLKTTYTYQTCNNNGSYLIPDETGPNTYTVIYYQNSLFWKMNFGWEGSNDEAEYGANSDWQTYGGLGSNFRYNKKIIYNIN